MEVGGAIEGWGLQVPRDEVGDQAAAAQEGRPTRWRPEADIFFWSTKKQYLIFLVDQLLFWSTKNYFLMFLVEERFF